MGSFEAQKIDNPVSSHNKIHKNVYLNVKIVQDHNCNCIFSGKLS